MWNVKGRVLPIEGCHRGKVCEVNSNSIVQRLVSSKEKWSHLVVSDSLRPRGLSQASPSMGFSRQEYWSGLPFPSLGDLADPGIEPESPTLQADALPSEPPAKKTRVRTNWLLRSSSHGPVRLRLCASKAGGAGSIPGWETKTPHAVWFSQKYFFLKKEKDIHIPMADSCWYMAESNTIL